MLTIHVNSTPLVLPDDLKIRVEYNAPYLDTEGIPADVVWHFDVPVAGNEDTFKYVNILQVRRKKHTFNAVVCMHGYPIGRGLMLVNGYNHSKFRVVITLRSFGVLFDGVTLNQGKYAPVNIGGTPHSQAQVLLHMQQVNSEAIVADYRFPTVYAPEFFGDKNDAGHPVYNPTYGDYINNVSESGMVLNTPNNNPQSLVPMPLLFPAIGKALGGLEYSFTGNVQNHDELKNLLAFSRVSLDSFDFDYMAKVYLTDKQIILPAGKSHVPFVNNSYPEASDTRNTMFNGYYTVVESGKYEVGCNLFAYYIGNKFFDIDTFIYIYVNDVMRCSFTESRGSLSVNKTVATPDGSVTYSYFCKYECFLRYKLQLNAGDTVDIRFSTYDKKLKKYVPSYIQDQEMMYVNTHYYNDDVRQNWFSCRSVSADNRNDHQNSILLGNHIPVVPVTTVLNTIRNLFFATLFFDDDKREVEMTFLDDVLNTVGSVDITNHIVVRENEGELNQTLNPAISYAHVEKVSDIASQKLLQNFDYPSELDIQPREAYALCNAINSVYEFTVAQDNTPAEWKYYGHNFLDYGDKEGDDTVTSISLEAGVVPLIEQNSKEYPYSTLMGVSHVIPNEEEEPGLQLMFWRGNVNGRPLASPVTLAEGNRVTGAISLDLNADNGPVRTFGTRWLQFLSDYEIVSERLDNVDIWLMLDMLSTIKPHSNKRWLMIKGVKCLPHQFSFVINRNGDIEECEVKAIKSNAI